MSSGLQKGNVRTVSRANALTEGEVGGVNCCMK